ncbi:MAG: hypothetical protein AAF390_04220 [Pseudomonadota bacterium]
MTENDLDNLGKSEVVVAKVLNLLMEWGIRECELRFSELDLSEDYAPFFYPCIMWLEAEGVIRVREYHRTMGGTASGLVDQPVLTSYGLSILGAKFNPGKSDEKVAEAVSDVSAGNGSYARAGNFAGGLLASFIKSMG